ncbi:Glycine dehydrogenase [decarboxylating] [Luteitalea pratensis]|uniref:Glycine dehydrogenase (decarboxylating) n=1 Tax=Luteitalea pratensis TaxID=1855912 RepID=A0A143PQ21_LUTPR|nr:aminomethyl-transferring glycine dehydrogenase [Luteitalea pratensis]AMY10220.1 Glycine dehydrogenase [decarboxylating] [Luteitalea pratensis]
MTPAATDAFALRHIGPRPEDRDRMLHDLGVPTLDALIDQVVPSHIRRPDPLIEPPAETEAAFLTRLRTLEAKNARFRSFIGAGYYNTHTPAVIQRMVLENPGWYTPYTPYQAEIAQGRLEALLTFQTAVSDLTGMDVANASLLDEATAAAEAMTLLRRVSKKPASAVRMLVIGEVFPQVRELLVSRAEPLGLRVDFVADADAIADDVFGVMVQYPDGHGAVSDIAPIITRAHEAGALVAVGSDLLALTLLVPPGELGADVVYGSAQRFGVPLGYGGPHAAFFATREAYVRQSPGRIIGVSVDAQGGSAYRMALQTREQHIRREKATSNICTAQALLANIAAFYAVFHGAEGLTDIAIRIHGHVTQLAAALTAMGLTLHNAAYFDTLRVSGVDAETLRAAAEAAQVNFRYLADGSIGISLDETSTSDDVLAISNVFGKVVGRGTQFDETAPSPVPVTLRRRSSFLTHPVFTEHRSELQITRFIRRLERRDIGLDTSMIPLGSCTMKLNAAAEMLPITWPGFAAVHPFVPVEQASGYQEIFRDLERMLCDITGFAAVSLQPNSGAQGELAGLMVIRAYHRARGDSHRTVVLIPSSAHGTNPASAVMAGMKVVVVACDTNGNVDLGDLRAKAEQHKDTLAALMVTYPSTHGVYEDAIREICEVVHAHGGQVYMDGANMNAQVGLTSPALIGADVCHLNLHKTFAIPHGGGGPGMGPIGVARHLAPYLPSHPVVTTGGGASGIHAISAAPWGSALILLISYAYMSMLGGDGMTEATRYAILNANYIKARLEGPYAVLYTGREGRVAHELILDLRPLKQASGIDEMDVAKRLMDYGFHAPTVSFPVPGTLMIEPTESEDRDELDRFCDAMLAIRAEIQAVIDGTVDPNDNVLKHAPHTAAVVMADQWTRPYPRSLAAFPLPYLRTMKVWPTVGRIDNPFGDRHLVCACPPMTEYAEETVGA